MKSAFRVHKIKWIDKVRYLEVLSGVGEERTRLKTIEKSKWNWLVYLCIKKAMFVKSCFRMACEWINTGKEKDEEREK